MLGDTYVKVDIVACARMDISFDRGSIGEVLTGVHDTAAVACAHNVIMLSAIEVSLYYVFEIEGLHTSRT